MIYARLGNNNDAKKTPSTPQRPPGIMHTVISYGTTLHFTVSIASLKNEEI